MSARRKIAGWLRGVARRIDDTPCAGSAMLDARTDAILAMPTKVSRFVKARTFQRGAERNPLAVAYASAFEARSPGCYAGNDAMMAAILKHRASGGQHV